MSEIVLIDSAPLIYLIEGSAPRDADRAAATRAFLDSVCAEGARLYASTVAWTECLAGPMAAGNAARADEFRRRLSGEEGIVFEPVDIAVAEEASRLLSAPAPRPSFADAFHLATAAVIGARSILTNDDAWPGIASAAARRVPAYGKMRIVLVDELGF